MYSSETLNHFNLKYDSSVSYQMKVILPTKPELTGNSFVHGSHMTVSKKSNKTLYCSAEGTPSKSVFFTL